MFCQSCASPPLLSNPKIPYLLLPMVGDLAPYLDAGARASYPMVLNQIRLGRLVHVVGIRSIRIRKRGGELRPDSGNSCFSLVVTKTIVIVTSDQQLAVKDQQL